MGRMGNLSSRNRIERNQKREQLSIVTRSSEEKSRSMRRSLDWNLVMDVEDAD